MAYEFTQSDMQELAAHLRTLGAYVQPPIPQIVGLSNYQVIGSQDAKSLYPTIMVLLNIGFDTLKGRIYEWKIVGPVLTLMNRLFEIKYSEPEAIDIGINNFKNAFQNMLRNFTDKNKKHIKSVSKYTDFNGAFYPDCFKKIIKGADSLEQVFHPKTDEDYFLLKSALYPLLEAMTWMSVNNKGYSNTVIDWVFFNGTFKEKYSEEDKFVIFDDINSSKTQVLVLQREEFINRYATKYVLNPYGTFYYTHDDKKSFEVDLILQGMDDRGFVKNQMLIINAITENFKKLSDEHIKALILNNEKLDEKIAEEIIELVGDPNDKKRAWQLSVLKGIVFDTRVDETKLKKQLELRASQRNSRSNGIKVTLNSGYGIYGMSTWNYGNNLIANSITTGGKIYGIKLFQQIASNRLKVEREKIERGDYNEQYPRISNEETTAGSGSI